MTKSSEKPNKSPNWNNKLKTGMSKPERVSKGMNLLKLLVPNLLQKEIKT